MARRRLVQTAGPVRAVMAERDRAEGRRYLESLDLDPDRATCSLLARADALEAGQVVEVVAWELPDTARRGIDPDQRVRLYPDGRIAPTTDREE